MSFFLPHRQRVAEATSTSRTEATSDTHTLNRAALILSRFQTITHQPTAPCAAPLTLLDVRFSEYRCQESISVVFT